MTDIKDTPDSNYDADFHFDDIDASHDFATPESEALNSDINTRAGTKEKTSGASFSDELFHPKNKWNVQPRNSRKIIIFGFIIAVIVFFIIYHFASNWSNSFGELHHVPAPKILTQTAESMTPAQIARNEQQAKTAAEKEKIEAVENKTHTLDQTIDQQQQTITQLQANIEALQGSMSSLNSAVTTLSEKLDMLDNKFAKPVIKAPAKTLLPKAPPVINYIIRAMVPGRAWLQASNGSTLSVAVGNEVPGHGTVANVDLNAGQVVMSDGSVFAYNIDGN